MNPIVALYKKMMMKSFNKKNNTNICSTLANLSAVYGEQVRIDEGTRITKDVTIGDFSYVNHDSSLQNCDIGKYCSISSNVNISPYNHNMSGLTTHPIGDTNRVPKRVVIGNDVLISLNVIILEGVHIGDGAVIGAGAVVTHDVGNYEIWVGVPAKFIHYRVKNELQRKSLSELKWWDAEPEKRRQLVDKYRNMLNDVENEH